MGQRMVAAHDDARFGRYLVQDAEFRLARRGKADDEVELAPSQPITEVCRAADCNVQGYLRTTLAHACHEARHDGSGKTFHDADRDMSAHCAAQLHDLANGPLLVILPAQYLRDDDLAGGRQPHSSRKALEQRRAVFMFEIEQPTVHRRWRRVQFRGGPTDRSRLRNLDQPDGGWRNERHEILPNLKPQAGVILV